MPDPELLTILEDVRTIKSILMNTDAPLPPVWRLLQFVAAPALLVIALLKFFVPALSVLSFLDTLLWLWFPVMAVAALVILFRIRIDLKRTGTRFLAQGRVQVFFYTRLILVPSILILGYLLSLNSAYSLEGAMLVLIAVGMTQVVVIMPHAFKLIPAAFLLAGIFELALGWRGPEWVLGNTLAVAGALVVAAALLKQGENRGAPRG